MTRLFVVDLHLLKMIKKKTVKEHSWEHYAICMMKSKAQQPRARNNFRIVSGHDDRRNSFLLGHVSFLAGQMYMMNYSFRGP